jgi:hypothetical protein
MLGKIVFEGTFEGEKLELELSHSGIYTVNIDNRIRTKVIIKN